MAGASLECRNKVDNPSSTGLLDNHIDRTRNVLPDFNNERYAGEDMGLLGTVVRAVAIHAGVFSLYGANSIEPGLETRILGSFLKRQFKEIEKIDSVGQLDSTENGDGFVFDGSSVSAQYLNPEGIHFMFLGDEELNDEETGKEDATLNIGRPTLTTLAMEILRPRNCNGGELYDIEKIPDLNQIHLDTE